MTDRIIILATVKRLRRIGWKPMTITDPVVRRVVYYAAVVANRTVYPMNRCIRDHHIGSEWWDRLENHIKDRSNSLEFKDFPYYHSVEWLEVC